ncbi:S24/S26 family peptidase [Paenibacillus sp. FSL H8-0548]|uniref:S24/S26 family peptidase n=1 Tax=Paenibacillus sp. FSL H8-0548 TaxID=1920422 RepID=UPI00117F732B|nr:S24/S26 family peptidase [Paenibacillus sp. FSL H8-0548]
MLVPMLEDNLDVLIPVSGNSMYPLWKHNRDSVVVTSCNPYALKKGDIPLYRRASGQVVMHRIIRVNQDGYDMCGDIETQIEYNLPKDNIIAVVKCFTRKGQDYSCTHFGYKMYSFLWIRLRPLRRFFLKGYREWMKRMPAE